MQSYPVLVALFFVVIVLITISTGSYVEGATIYGDFKQTVSTTEVNNVPPIRETETFIEMVENEGYTAEEHEVTTEDGYILTIHRIPGGPRTPVARGKQPVLLLHGLLGASDVWVYRGAADDFAYMLVDNGYDVWALNTRGNYYSKRHRVLSTTESSFWRFSWHEFGAYDTAASIDYILSVTGMPRVSMVGHSMGSTVELVLLSKRPEYNDKVNVAVNFAPVAIVTHSFPGLIINLGILFGKQIMEALRLLNRFELFPRYSIDLTPFIPICQSSGFKVLCQRLAFYLFGITHVEDLDISMLPRVQKHYPQGTSIETMLHYRQIILSGKFEEYDFGLMRNYLRYKSFTPPEYQLEKITAPVFLYYGLNDLYTTKKDIEAIATKISNAIPKEIPYKNFGHLDFLALNDTKTILYDDVMQVLDGYRNSEVKEFVKNYA